MRHYSKSGLFLLIAILAVAQSFSRSIIADDYTPENFTEAQAVEYERQLNALLKTRRDEEKEFVSKIVTLVRMGVIPSKLVSTSYQWGHKNRPNSNYPFIYFEKVIRIQAKAIKLDSEIPAFDYSIYRSAGQIPGGNDASAGQRTQANRNFFSRRPKIR